MDITYTTINVELSMLLQLIEKKLFKRLQIIYQRKKYKVGLVNLKRIIDEQYETLNSKDKEIEEARNQQQHIVLVDLKQKTQPIGDI